ncbi:M20 family metallopeptidase [Paenibacillus crassostreae]|uniref:Peptidase M20 n=1 Tax=Paenibacillus crassostreae TaxID=1763538 RepID=A0A167C7I0_9BACL|nr:M20 family metallopeptidase [Paenibacillus crassostreae]AOZ91548.1 peptidase M20 [Paenibacillus crassostreae]OAB72878.1 peptidase M20 [Paenibacillus crassostreae]
MDEKLLNDIQVRMIQWRRHLHQHPELSYQEENTALFVATKLRELGLQVQTKFGGGYGVVATLHGALPGKTIALRADMDALPIEDEKDCKYRSEVKGVMHACGHDGHTSMLLGVASYFTQLQSQLRGNIVFIFQPAEEVCPGGAQGMIQSGVLNGVDAIYGIHLWTPLPVGTVGTAGGPFMAAADEFFIDMIGKGGHGGIPHVTIDSIVAGSAVVMQLQSIVSRSVDPLQPAVVTIGTIEGGFAQNVIAEKCRITGTVRTFDIDTRLMIRDRIESMVSLTAQSYGAKSIVDYVMGYPPLVNDQEEVERFFRVAEKNFKSDRVLLVPKLMIAEDFAYYVQEIPGCFMLVGAGNADKAMDYPHHHPLFDFDEEAMYNGLKLFIAMVESHQ